jgi:hypothetical protein
VQHNYKCYKAEKSDCREVITKRLRKYQNAVQDIRFRIPTFVNTANINLTFAVPTDKMLLIKYCTYTNNISTKRNKAIFGGTIPVV